MNKKVILSIMLTLLLINLSTWAFDIQPVEQAFASSTKGASLLSNGGFEIWSGTPLSPDKWSIVTIGPVYDPGAIHKSTIAFEGNFSLRLGSENDSEAGWNLGIVMDQNVSVYAGMAYRLAFCAFGRNPWGTLAGGIRVDWLDAAGNVIGIAIPRVPLPTTGSPSYGSFAAANSPAPSGAAYARIYVEKMSRGFINFDDVTFTTTDTWPMLQHDPQHTGYSTDDTIYPVPPLSKIWEFDTGSSISCPPVVSNDGVYVARRDGYVYKFDPFTGLPKWSSPAIVGAQIEESPAVNEAMGQLYVGSVDGCLRAIYTSNGSIKWMYNVGSPNGWSAPIFSGGNVYVGSEDCWVYKINGTGALIWKFQPPTPPPVVPVTSVALESGIVYAAANLIFPLDVYRLYAFNDTTPPPLPNLLWERCTQFGGLISLPAVAYGKVYACYQDRTLLPHLSAFDASTGFPMIWDKPDFYGPFAVAYGKIYISSGNQVYALNASTGALVPGWKVYTENPMYDDGGMSTLVANGVVYAVFARTEPPKSILVALDATTGNKLWELTADSILMPVIAHGSLYISSSKGDVYCYSYDPNIGPTRFVDAIAVWSHDAGSPNLNDIYYSIYDASVDTWWTLAGTRAAPIANLTGDDNFPAIAFDYINNAIAVWSHTQIYGTSGFDIYYSRWLGSAVGWSTPLPVASPAENDRDPAVALWKDGTGVCIWTRDNGEVWWSRLSSSGWAGPNKWLTFPSAWPVGLTQTYPKQPEVAYDANNNAIAVWTDSGIAGAQVYYSVLFSGASSWTSPIPIPNQLNGSALEHRKGISSDRNGNAKVVWGPEAQADWDLQYAEWTGASFDPAATIYPGSEGLDVAVAFDGGNNAIEVTGKGILPGPADDEIWYNLENPAGWDPPAWTNGYGDTLLSEPRITFLRAGNARKAVVAWKYKDDIWYNLWVPNIGWNTPTPVALLPGMDAPWEGPVSIASSSGSPTMAPLVFSDTIPGDVDGNGVVDIFDVVKIALAFGSEPGYPNWNQAADINRDDVVDIFDVVILATNFGKTA